MKFLNYYKCDQCGYEWTDEWSCMCNDKCERCGVEVEPHDSSQVYPGHAVTVEANGDRSVDVEKVLKTNKGKETLRGIDRMRGRVEAPTSHTSDEGTGCVVPESIRRLSEQWQEEYDDLLAGDDGMQEYLRGKRDAGHELDRAIAEARGEDT